MLSSNGLFILNEREQNFKPKIENKIQYGEVNTPFSLIQEILNMIPEKEYKDPTKKWLDPACGCGYFTMVLFNKLMNGLRYNIRNREKRKKHIIENMIYMCEINQENIIHLTSLFGENANIIQEDFLSTTKETYGDNLFDFIIGNPPYNGNGLKKVPTNSKSSKKKDGKTLWTEFVKHSLSLLRGHGFLSMIIPSIWMKPDKANMYETLTYYKIHKIKAFSNTQTNKIFKNQAQTPTCYFLLEKREDNTKDEPNNVVSLYDTYQKEYIPYTVRYQSPIPLTGISIINKLNPFIEKYGCLEPIKTNLPSKYISITPIQDKIHKYRNIKTCIIEKTGFPHLVIDYSNKPCKYQGEKKLVLAHKMYGTPYFDKTGEYGISNRDNYVFLHYQDNEFQQLQQFLSTKTILFLYDTTRYRMRYLEKYAFQFIPDITKILHEYQQNQTYDNSETQKSSYMNEINDEYLRELFHLTENEYQFILNANKTYHSFTN